jgi:hypothetical protein
LGRASALLGANVLLALATLWLIGAYARSTRRRAERTSADQAAEASA